MYMQLKNEALLYNYHTSLERNWNQPYLDLFRTPELLSHVIQRYKILVGVYLTIE